MRLNLLGIGLMCLSTLSLLVQVNGQPIEQPLRVAVWDPQFGSNEGRFTIRMDLHDQAAQWLTQAGMAVQRITSDQVADPAQFSAQRFDVFVHQGDIIPRNNIESLKQFTDQGGVVVVLAAKIPWLMGVETSGTGKDRQWRLSPANPRFAWETQDLLRHVGMRYVYSPGQHDQGRHHHATELLKKYWPQVPMIAEQMLPHRWVIPMTTDQGTGEVYPLMRSFRMDDRETMPQVWVARLGKHMAVISGSDLFTGNSNPALWSAGREMVSAMVRLAGDLRHGKVNLNDFEKSVISDRTPPPGPLTTMPATEGIEPTGVQSVARWGRFNGSLLELGPATEPGQRLELAADSAGMNRFPRRLEAGASVTVRFTASGASDDQPMYLRVRGAFQEGGAGLGVRVGDMIAWSEIFNFVDAGGPGNFQASDLKDVPAEFTRIIYLPMTHTPDKQQAVTIFNPGSLPVFFDALQVEVINGEQPRWKIGFNGGFQNVRAGEPSPIDPAKSQLWSGMRGDSQMHKIGPPGDPKRYEFMDRLIANQLKVNRHLELILLYTPEWAAVSPERLEEGKRAWRAHTIVPNLDQWEQLVREVVARYGEHIDVWELWNEANISQFWRGSAEEYIALYQRIAPLVRELDPGAKVTMCGMAGHHDEFMKKLLAAGVLHDTDTIPLHPYAGRSAGWDVVYGQMQGWLFNHGVNKPIDNNEVGSPWFNSEWWVAPMRTEFLQADLTNRGMARLLATDASMVSLFHAGGDAHAYGMIDETGRARPAYDVVADYLNLAQRDGRKAAVSLQRVDGQPVQGVYVAAARHEDGALTMVINPSEVSGLDEPMPPGATQELHDGKGWEAFQGRARYGDGHAYVSVAADQQYMGLAKTAELDLQTRPMLRVYVSHTTGWWEVAYQDQDKNQTVLFKATGPATREVDLRKLLPDAGSQGKGRLVIRCSKDATVRYVSFGPDPVDTQKAIAQWRQQGQPIPMMVRFPWPFDSAVATLRWAGETYEVPVKLQRRSGLMEAEIQVTLRGRSVVMIEQR